MATIAESCRQWANLMETGLGQEGQIVDNIRKDPCVKRALLTQFFDRLAAKGRQTTVTAAKQAAYEVVHEEPERFMCSGNDVPQDRFRDLFRFERVESLRYRVPEALDSTGLTDGELKAISDDELRSVTDEWHGDVVLGNGLSLVWVTDSESALPLATDLQRLGDRLGVLIGPERCIICVYKRSGTGRSLHVPRFLDAIDMPQFEPVQDCSAGSGKTRPLTLPAAEGMPEAVHRSCTVRPDVWKLRELKNDI